MTYRLLGRAPVRLSDETRAAAVADEALLVELELGLARGEARVVGAWRSVYTVHTVYMVHMGMHMGMDMGMDMGMHMGMDMASGVV